MALDQSRDVVENDLARRNTAVGLTEPHTLDERLEAVVHGPASVVVPHGPHHPACVVGDFNPCRGRPVIRRNDFETMTFEGMPRPMRLE